MTAPPNKPPLALDMDFDEAMKRFANTNLDDLPDNVKLKKIKKKKRAKKAPSKRKSKPD